MASRNVFALAALSLVGTAAGAACPGFKNVVVLVTMAPTCLETCADACGPFEELLTAVSAQKTDAANLMKGVVKRRQGASWRFLSSVPERGTGKLLDGTPTLTRMGLTPVDIDHICQNFVDVWPNAADVGPNLVSFATDSAIIGQCGLHSSQFEPTSIDLGPTLDQFRSKARYQIWPGFGQFCPDSTVVGLARLRPSLAPSRPTSAEFGAGSTNMARSR